MIRKTCKEARFPPLSRHQLSHGDHGVSGHLLIDQNPNRTASKYTSNDRQWKRRGRIPQAHTTCKNHSLKTLAKDSHKRQDEHSIPLAPNLELAPPRLIFDRILGLKGLCQLELPFVLQLRDTKEGRAHDADDDGGDQGKDTFPDLLRTGPGVGAETVEGADHPAADDEADDEADAGAEPDL